MKLVGFSYISNYEIQNINLENVKDTFRKISEYSSELFEYVKEV